MGYFAQRRNRPPVPPETWPLHPHLSPAHWAPTAPWHALLTTLLAIDTATDALSLAFSGAGQIRRLHRVMPRQHQQQLFACLDELLDSRPPAELGIDAVLYGRGPGSFTGLRIAASAAQGLAYSLKVPVVGLSTLETQVRTLQRQQRLEGPGVFLSTIDAHIGQIYAAFFAYDGEALAPMGDAIVAEPDALTLPDELPNLSVPGLIVLGSGYASSDAVPTSLGPVGSIWPEVLPEAEDMLAPGAELFARGEASAPGEAIPDYVQKRIGWKTLAEQGRKA